CGITPPQRAGLLQGLQAVAVLQWIFFWGSVCLAALIPAILGRAWILALLYLVWLSGDRDWPHAGGHCSAWVGNWAIWRHFQDGFPVLVRGTQEQCDGGMFPAEASNFCTDTSGFLGLFPGLWPHLLRLSGWFHLPRFRDYTMCSGLLSSDKASAAYLLSRPEGGQVAVLAAGGLLEALDPKASALTLRIRNQKGFVKAHGLGGGFWPRRAGGGGPVGGLPSFS
uniref:Uncharacterized protein n=1 Tax=Lynx canadensis TaxID=61383 RepID=A0A667HN42_LYNCA